MKYFSLITLLVLLNLTSYAEQPFQSKKFNKELVKFFESKSLSTTEIEELSNKTDKFFKVLDGDEQLGFAVYSSAIGRYDKFDFMIIYNFNYELELVKILVYRSEYGAEITAKNWLKQFNHKQTDSLKYGSDIQAISGATFSAISITKNINRINELLLNYTK